AGTNLSIVIERQNTHPFRPEFRRHVLLLADNAPLVKLEMAYDGGGQSRALLFQLSDRQLLLQDATNDYPLDLNRRSLSRRGERQTDTTRAKLLGVFEASASGEWRFDPTAATTP
ncbi:MAG TPA: hypothetical protein VF754_07390, partial [Pyrinomonadaceae bacterium]